jgi:uncharacterized protein (TIRG00374 family)
MHKEKNKISLACITKRKWLLLILAAVALYILAPELKLFHESLNAMEHVRLLPLTYVGLYVISTFFLSALTYRLLVGSKYRYTRGLFIEFAGMFTNRLLPAGIGGIGLNFSFLRKQKYSKTEAFAVITTNNLLGLLGHIILSVIILGIFHKKIPTINIHYSARELYVGIVCLVIVGVGMLYVIINFHGHFLRVTHDLMSTISNFSKRPYQLALALLSSIGLTVSNVLALYFCSLALNLHLSLVIVFVVFTFGILLGTASPTPGGLGGTEAGLIAGLVALHVSAANALALALVFRVISFWIPFICGGIVFAVIKKLNYV